MSDCSPHNLTKRGSVEFVSSSASLIRNHFSYIFFEARDSTEVRSNSSYLFATRVISPNSLSFRHSALSASTLTKLGAPSRNRTTIAGLQNRSITIILIEQIKQDSIFWLFYKKRFGMFAVAILKLVPR